jgi:hypothetical protein
MEEADTLAYYDTATITAAKSFKVEAPWSCTIKHYRLTIYGKWSYFVVS